MTQASAICVGLAEWASATSRSTAISSLVRVRYSGPKRGLVARTRLAGGAVP